MTNKKKYCAFFVAIVIMVSMEWLLYVFCGKRLVKCLDLLTIVIYCFVSIFPLYILHSNEKKGIWSAKNQIFGTEMCLWNLIPLAYTLVMMLAWLGIFVNLRYYGWIDIGFMVTTVVSYVSVLTASLVGYRKTRSAINTGCLIFAGIVALGLIGTIVVLVVGITVLSAIPFRFY